MKRLYVFLFILCVSCKNETLQSIIVYHNGEILTINEANDQVEAIAVEGDKIIAIGRLKSIEAEFEKTKKIEKIDLQGSTLMPGIYESHSHPIWGAMRDLHQINFPWGTKPNDLKVIIEEYIDEHKPSIVLGGAWASQYFEINTFESPVKWLDAITDKIPIVLFDDASHNLWVNSAALKLGNIDRNTRDPKNGKILKDADGNPNGLLYENATFLIRDQIIHEETKYRGAIEYAQKQALGYGIIGIRDAAADEKSIEVFSAMDREGKINMYFGLCQATPNMSRDTILNIDKYIKAAERNKTENINPYFIKFFLDGVPTTSRTAALLCDYKVDEKHPEPTKGMIHIEPSILFQDVANLDKNGFSIKIHGAGDRSARLAIDAIAHARLQNGMNNQIHELAHAEFITPEDIARMQELSMAADLSPYLWYPSPIIDNVQSAICEEMKDDFFPINTLYSANIHCVTGSDWPAAAMNLNPWIGLEAMVTRKNPMTDEDAAYVPEQAISLKDALRIFTINGAKSMGRAEVSGSLEVGKFADFIILDKAIFQIDPDEISDIKVINSYYKGIKR